MYTGIYRYEDHKLVTVKAQTAIAMDELLDELNTLEEEVTFLGDGVPAFNRAFPSGQWRQVVHGCRQLVS